MIQSALGTWRTTITRLNAVVEGLSEAEFYQEIAPGRNRIIYPLGHLTAVHDLTLEVLGSASGITPNSSSASSKTRTDISSQAALLRT